MKWFRDLGRDKPWAQGCIVAAAGCFLAVSGCFGYLLTLNFNGTTNPAKEGLGLFLGAFFVAGALAVPVGFVWWLVGLLKRRSGASGPGAPPPPPSAPPTA